MRTIILVWLWDADLLVQPARPAPAGSLLYLVWTAFGGGIIFGSDRNSTKTRLKRSSELSGACLWLRECQKTVLGCNSTASPTAIGKPRSLSLTVGSELTATISHRAQHRRTREWCEQRAVLGSRGCADICRELAVPSPPAVERKPIDEVSKLRYQERVVNQGDCFHAGSGALAPEQTTSAELTAYRYPSQIQSRLCDSNSYWPMNRPLTARGHNNSQKPIRSPTDFNRSCRHRPSIRGTGWH